MKTTQIPKLPQFSSDTHKGEYGRVLVVGGSEEYYGAPILTALGAESAGADLITVCMPKEHFEAAKRYSLNFFLKQFSDNKLTPQDTVSILKYANMNHVLVIGNGLGKDTQTQNAILTILEHVQLPVVLDAEALFPAVLEIKHSLKNWILTPHHGEFERLCGVPFSVKNLQKKSEEHECTFLVKGPIDYIAQNGKVYENHTGCVQMRVGGTGDALAGITASYRSQGLKNLEAARAAAYYFGKAGENLTKKCINFSAYELLKFYFFSQ